MRYYCDPMADCTLEEAHAMDIDPMPEFWLEEDIPKGCERHFVPIDEERIAAILRGRADANRG